MATSVTELRRVMPYIAVLIFNDWHDVSSCTSAASYDARCPYDARNAANDVKLDAVAIWRPSYASKLVASIPHAAA